MTDSTEIPAVQKHWDRIIPNLLYKPVIVRFKAIRRKSSHPTSLTGFLLNADPVTFSIILLQHQEEEIDDDDEEVYGDAYSNSNSQRKGVCEMKNATLKFVLPHAIESIEEDVYYSGSFHVTQDSIPEILDILDPQRRHASFWNPPFNTVQEMRTSLLAYLTTKSIPFIIIDDQGSFTVFNGAVTLSPPYGPENLEASNVVLRDVVCNYLAEWQSTWSVS